MTEVVGRRVEDTDGGPPGAFCYEKNMRGLFYVCPCGCGVEGYLAFHRPGMKEPNWIWDGNVERPTLTPSVHHVIRKGRNPKTGNWVEETHYHGHLRAGVWVA